jgi:hypothetical protein
MRRSRAGESGLQPTTLNASSDRPNDGARTHRQDGRRSKMRGRIRAETLNADADLFFHSTVMVCRRI